jgi:hypothetical protein
VTTFGVVADKDRLVGRDRVEQVTGPLVGGRRSALRPLRPVGVPVGALLGAPRPFALGLGERAGRLVDADLDLEPGGAEVLSGPVDLPTSSRPGRGTAG